MIIDMAGQKTRQVLILFIISTGLAVIQVDSYCDRIYRSTGESQGGEFVANHGVNSKPFKIFLDEKGNLIANKNHTNSTGDDQRPMHCLYKFIGREDERVVLNFTSFRMKGDEPECSQEYVDIFVKFRPTDDLGTAIGYEPSNGRFCTTIRPRQLVSLHNMIVLIVYSELKQVPNRKPLFTGNYQFIKSKPNDQIGPPAQDSLCNHVISSSERRDGEFQSVTYPGVYVKGLRCSYKFVGELNQRIRIEFLDLDLYSGGSHCPLDSIRVFDGLEETDPVINTICGSHRSLIIYSTRENLLITFTTTQREAEIQNRGFSAYFEFGDKFVDPSFIQGQSAKHIRGSECDQRIISHKGTSGIIVSPDPKHHTDTICRYIFEGLQTSLDYEKVMLKFIEFDLKTPRSASSLATTTTTTTTTTTPQPPTMFLAGNSNLLLFNQTLLLGADSSSINANNTSVEQCTDNYVRLYTGEQKPDQKQDPNDYDYVYCNNEIPPSIESDAASLLMEYKSGSIGGHFKAEYTFIVDFRIPGVQASAGCNYLYRSEFMKNGTFNSPRHPSWYINDINCTYTFLTKNDEALLLQFGTFKMFSQFDEKILSVNQECRGEDLVEIFELVLDAAEQRIIDQTEIGTYCGNTTPGPILSYRPLKITFKTNKEKVHYGFSAIYSFFSTNELKSNEFVTNCGGQIYANQRQKTGNIRSPETYRPETYEKRNHICSWNITARPNHKIALDFNKFELEGSPIVRGCITASVRLNLGRSKIPREICGTLSPANGSAHQFISENEWLSLTFISTKQASGSNGFSANWTEIKRSS